MKNEIYEKIYDRLLSSDIHRQLIEEMAELTHILCKFDRIGSLNPPANYNTEYENILYNTLEEIADVKNCLRMLSLEDWYDAKKVNEIKIEKMKRWRDRLNGID